MASLVDSLTASGGTESAGFLNDMIAQLWPNINVAACRMIKEIVEPMFASMLPGPLATLHFTKLDLGSEPLRLSKVDTHKTEMGGIKLDMDIDWEGKSDIDLDGKMVPKMGIERIRLKGRLCVLLAPLTNIIPLIGAAQVAFINTPELKLNFTGAADIADCFLVEKMVRKVILDIIASMAVLPNRYLVKLSNDNDFFKTYLPHHGVLRLTVEKAQGLNGPKKHGAKGLLSKIIKDTPDPYCNVQVGAEGTWRTTTKKNNRAPEWNETHDFLVADYDQSILIDIDDDDLGSDDDMGVGATTVKKLLLSGGAQTLPLLHNGELVPDADVTVHGTFYNLVEDPSTLQNDNESDDENKIVGLATILVASALGLQGNRDELHPSVRVTFGETVCATATKSYSPGMDIFNPSFDQAFRVPLTAAVVAAAPVFRIELMNGKELAGSAVEIPFAEVLEAPGLVREEGFDVGAGVLVRASISVRGLQRAE